MATKSKKPQAIENIGHEGVIEDFRVMSVVGRDMGLVADQTRPMIVGWMTSITLFVTVVMFCFSLVVLTSSILSALSVTEVWAVAEGGDIYQLKILKGREN